MNKGLDVNVEIGLCTKEMARDNPIKDFEILVEEYKDKWSKQMYDYFKVCVSVLKKELKALEIIRNKRVIVGRLIFSKDLWEYNNYVSYDMELTQEEYDLLKEMLL